jgi:hypothetical protein
MKWFDIVKAPPTTFRGTTWKFFAPGDIPYLEDLIMAKDAPWEELWPTVSRKIFFEKDQTFTPKLKGKGVGFWAIMNITNGELVGEGWEMMRTRETLGKDPDPESITEVQWGMGMNSIELTPNQIGVEVIKYGATPKVEVTIPPESNVLSKIGESYMKDKFETNPGNYQLNNGEAAALAILGIFAEQRNPRERKNRIRYFKEFNIGPLQRESNSKYLRGLEQKGLVDYGSMRDDISSSNRGYPRITNEGYREATMQVDMPRAVFFSEEMEEGPNGQMIPYGFKAKVLKQPDAPYMGYEGGALAEG